MAGVRQTVRLRVRPLSRLGAAVWLILLGCALPGVAQHRSSGRVGVNTVDAPIPDPLLKGKRAFISYELGDVTAFPRGYSGGPERAYSEFYAQMKQWGRYELVADPKDADIVFAIRFVDPPAIKAQVRVGISDAKTHVSLWGFVEEVDSAVRKKNRDNSFSDSISLLVSDVRQLIEPAAGAPATP